MRRQIAEKRPLEVGQFYNGGTKKAFRMKITRIEGKELVQVEIVDAPHEYQYMMGTRQWMSYREAERTLV